MASINLKHTSGNGTILNSPAANPSSDITLKLPSTTGSAGQVLKVASANHSSTNAELEFAADAGGKIVQVKSVSKLDSFSVASPTALQYYDVTGLDNLQITTTGSNKVIVFMTVHIGMPASGYRVFMKGIRTTSGSVTNLSYPSSSTNNIEASSTVVSASNSPHARVPYPLHIVGFEDSPSAGTHQYGIQIGTANTVALYTGRPYEGTNSTSYGTSPSGTITLYEVEV
jgi:hypothetical protein